MFEHLDDDAPVEPSDELRDAVARRAARLRRRRVLMSGGAAVGVAAIVVAVVALVVHDPHPPRRVVTSPGRTTTSAPATEGTLPRQVAILDGTPIGVQLRDDRLAPGEAFVLKLDVENTSKTTYAFSVRVCVDGNCEHNVSTSAAAVAPGGTWTTTISQTAPRAPGHYDVVVRGSKRGELRLAIDVDGG